MDRRAKAALNRDKAARLNESWGVGATQVRYSDDGHWYAALERFPAALFDAHGYLLFHTEAEYRASQYLSIGKQINVRKPGISAVPGYVRVNESNAVLGLDVDIHTAVVDEGRRRLILHLQRERNRTVIRNKKKLAASLECEICGFCFVLAYGPTASDYCEVHHLLPLAGAKDVARTRLEDLAIVCANCHRVIHLQNPPYTMAQVRCMLGLDHPTEQSQPAGA
jgi:predicted HNH restriction endonuclease